MSKELLTLALEALEPFTTPNWAGTGVDKANEAITALREALAEQPAQVAETRKQERPSFVEWTTDYVQDNLHKLKPAPVQQEPVAKKTRIGLVTSSGWNTLPVGTEFYTSPPAQRTWVGLTIDDIIDTARKNVDSIRFEHDFARAIEAKLKAKNT